MSCLPKPVLRGHTHRHGLKMLAGATIFAAFNASLFHFLVGNPKREAFENFVRTYDPDAHFKELLKYGYLHSAKDISEGEKKHGKIDIEGMLK